MNRQERANELEATIEQAIGDLEESMANGHSEDFVKALEWWSQLREYSFNNSILILLQRPNAVQMAGFKKWESLGFHVRKGERATWIRGPVIKKVEDEDTGEMVRRLVGYMPLCVFDIAQCAEWPDKQPPQPFQPSTNADWEHLYDCWRRRLSTLYSIEVKETQMGGMTYGLATDKSIRINARLEASIKGPVLLHELSHIVAKHPSAEVHAKWSRQERELQVEAATYVLCRMLGATHPNAGDYLLNYQVKPGQLREHLETIGQTVRDVREILNFRELSKEPESAAECAA